MYIVKISIHSKNLVLCTKNSVYNVVVATDGSNGHTANKQCPLLIGAVECGNVAITFLPQQEKYCAQLVVM